jgi:MOSC domain-containing protein YiiM
MASVEGIYIAAQAEADPRPVERVRAVPGQGLEGDRYFAGDGTFFEQRKPGQDVTLIEAEALEALAREHGIDLAPGTARRNVVTRGIGLNDLVGRRFRVGAVECVGNRLCDPCSHLQKMTQPGVLKGLVNRGGLRADVIAPGEISVGDDVVDLGPAEA